MIHEDEVQGHIANKGKPPLDAYLVLIILLLHYYRFYKLHGFYFIYVSGSTTRSFIIPPLRVQPSCSLLITHLLVMWCLAPYHPCRRFSKRSWTIGREPSLKRFCENVFKKEVFRKPWYGVALPKCEFMKRKRFSGRKVAGGKWRKLFSKNFGD